MTKIELELFTMPEAPSGLKACAERYKKKHGVRPTHVAFRNTIPSDYCKDNMIAGIKYCVASFVLTPHHIALYYEEPKRVK